MNKVARIFAVIGTVLGFWMYSANKKLRELQEESDRKAQRVHDISKRT